MNVSLVLPVVLPLAVAGIMVMFWGAVRLQRVLSVMSTGLLLLIGVYLLTQVSQNGIQVVQFGDWPAPFGVTFVCDTLSALMVTITGLVAFCAAIYSLSTIDEARERHAYYPLMQVLLAGISGAFLTGDLFNLYVWFEVMLTASFVLLSVGGGKLQAGGAVKYVLLNLLSSTLFVAALGVLYGSTGTLNMADMAMKLHGKEDAMLVTSSAVLLFISFGIKAGVFPLFFWLPASYHTAPPVISAVFAGLLTKVGVYSLVRTSTLIFPFAKYWFQDPLLFVAGMTMLVGVLGAASQMHFRRILSFHIISQVGYMIFGLALFTPIGLAGCVFYLVHHIVAKTNLFFIGGIIERMTGVTSVKKQGGFYRAYPLLALCFLAPALALAGIPPLSGFFAKFVVLKAGLEGKALLTTLAAVVVSLLTLYSMTKIWAESFWKDASSELVPTTKTPRIPWTQMGPVLLMALITVGIGIGSSYVYDFAEQSASELLDRKGYVQAVLGGER